MLQKKGIKKMICSICGNELVWQCDYDFEDLGREGEGIVSVWNCPKCGTEVELYIPSELNVKPEELHLVESE